MIDWQWDVVDELEDSEHWDKAFKITLNEWRCKPDDLKILIRLAFLCWHLLDYWLLFNPENLGEERVQKVLDEVTEYGFKLFNDEFDFLWIFGYMLKLFPYMFGEYFEMEQKGIDMIRQAHKINVEDSIVKMLYLASIKERNTEIEAEFKQASLLTDAILSHRFKGNGVLASYFRRVLNSYFL